MKLRQKFKVAENECRFISPRVLSRNSGKLLTSIPNVTKCTERVYCFMLVNKKN